MKGKSSTIKRVDWIKDYYLFIIIFVWLKINNQISKSIFNDHNLLNNNKIKIYVKNI